MVDCFEKYHPVVNVVYFFAVIIFAMFFLHPVYMALSLSGACIYSIILNGKKALKFNVVYMLPSMLVLACVNPLFNHEGMTILFYLKDGNPFTLESIIYGIVSATMIINVIIWFSCHNQIMSSDKIMYLFGKVIPASSLIFSMVLRFVPLYKARIKTISNAQKCIGNDVSRGNVLRRARNGLKILSIMVTWSLESSIETADSMKARGYGLKGRTAFSIYKMTLKDKVVLGLLAILIALVAMGACSGLIYVNYFPRIQFTPVTVWSSFVFISYFLLCYMPIFLNIYDEIMWRISGQNV